MDVLLFEDLGEGSIKAVTAIVIWPSTSYAAIREACPF